MPTFAAVPAIPQSRWHTCFSRDLQDPHFAGVKDVIFKTALEFHLPCQLQILGGGIGVLVRLTVIDRAQAEMGVLVIDYWDEVGVGNRYAGSDRTA